MPGLASHRLASHPVPRIARTAPALRPLPAPDPELWLLAGVLAVRAAPGSEPVLTARAQLQAALAAAQPST